MEGSGLVGVVRSGLDTVKAGQGWWKHVGFDLCRVRTGRSGYVYPEMGRGWSVVAEFCLGWAVGDQFWYW